MIKALIVVLIGICCSTSLLADEQPGNEISLSIEKITPDGTLKIGLHNVSKKDVNVWVGCHSWAYFNWRVIDIRNGETRLYAPYPYEGFTMNIPEAATIKPGQMIAEDIKLGVEDEWKKRDERPLMHWVGPKDTHPLIQDGDKIVVIYDVRWSEEANKYNAWVGLTETSKDFHLAAKN